jgi:hypothetical protein
VAPTIIPAANMVPITSQNISGSIIIDFLLRLKVIDG